MAEITFSFTECNVRKHVALRRAWIAQSVERILGKNEVLGSIPNPGSELSHPSL